MNFKKLPNELKDKLIDLSGLSDNEILEKMEELSGGEMMTLDTYQQYRDESWKMPKKVDRKNEVKKTKKILPKKKTPAYVAQFGLNHIKKRGK